MTKFFKFSGTKRNTLGVAMFEAVMLMAAIVIATFAAVRFLGERIDEEIRESVSLLTGGGDVAEHPVTEISGEISEITSVT